MKTCPNCGMESEEDFQKCPLCGFSFASEESNDEADEASEKIEDFNNCTPLPEPKRMEKVVPKKKNTIVIVLVTCIILLFFICMGLTFFLLHSNSNPENSIDSLTMAVETTAQTTIQTTISETATTTEPEQTTTETTTTKSGIDYTAAYCEALNQVCQDDMQVFRTYTLYDLNHDGILELVLKTGTYEADAKYKVWTIIGTSVQYCGDFPGEHTGLEEKDGELYAVYGMMGYESVYFITIDESFHVLTKNVYQSDGALEEYFDYGTRVVTYDVSDFSLLQQKSTANFDSNYYKIELN